MPLNTKGFLNASQRASHFQAHGGDFGAVDAQAYEWMADEFLCRPLGGSMLQCARSRGDMIRYDRFTDAFGVLDSAGVIRTFFKPAPCAALQGASLIAARQAGRCHAYASNLEYFRAECKRW